MLLPPETIAELCSQHHRQHRNLIEKFAGECSGDIYALQKAFPRSGTINTDFNALEQAKKFAAEKAAALAVVTEKHYYYGEPSMLTGVAHLVDLPIIRWDFIVEPYQLMQSKLWGADAVRIIVPLLDQIELQELYTEALKLNLEVIWELHSPADAERITDFAINSMIYCNGDEFSIKKAESIVKNLKFSAPALLDGDIAAANDIPGNIFKGRIFFNK